jgi:hypothetical protein
MAACSSSSHVKWISLRCFLRVANNQESGGVKSEIWSLRRVLKYFRSSVLYHPCIGSTSVRYGVSQNCSNKLVFHYSTMPVWVIPQFSWMLLLNFCLFKSCVVVRGLPDHCWSFCSKLPHSFLIFYPPTYRTYVHSVFTIRNQELLVNFNFNFHFHASETQ